MKFISAVVFICLSSLIMAQTTKTACIDCHSDNTLTIERNGKQISLFVDKDHFNNSVHAGLECTDCHSGFNSENIPHKEGNDISRVDCAQCHDSPSFSKSIHGEKKVECFACHSKHEIKPAKDFSKNEVVFCVSCHKSPSVRSYSKSTHHAGFLKGKKAPNCTDCHNKSAHEIKSVKFTKVEEEKLCASCHKKSDDEFATSVHKLAKKNNTPGCVNCHGAHEVFNNKYSISSRSCLKCHLDKNNFEKAGKINLVEFVKNYQTSIHGRIGVDGKEAATCVDCHDNHMVLGTDAAKSKISKFNIPNTCGKCHSNILADYKKSSHGVSFFSGANLAPSCTDCHGEHNIESVDKSPLSKLNEHKVCFTCHVNNIEVIKLTGKSKNEILGYENSVHFQALKAGNENAATCSDCHGAHKMQTTKNASSRIKRENIANTCGDGANCHPGIASDYMESIHAQAVKKGVMDAPTCIDCHGNHQIFAKDNPKSKVASGKNVVLLCSSCHGDVEMISKYGVPTTKASSYNESYHGLAVRGGSKYAADCSSCHGAHKIKPSSDSTSSINDNNLSKTCGRCHPGASITADFKQVHLTGSKAESPLLYWITRIYIVLILLVISGMLIHNILDFIRKRKEKKKHARELKELKEQGKYYLRMTLNERIQHFIMLTSFIALVVTGFALKYPDAWWVIPFKWILGEWAFQTRSFLHRSFGIFMITISFYHSYYLFFTKRGRQMLFDFLPNLQDLKDVITNVKYLLGISKVKPLFGRFSYMEKAEYWALIWGVIVMSATGLMLFFNTIFLSIAPKIFLDAATLVHLYEAWLATLSIIVWHFYFVIFNPEVYPLNTALITGVLSEEEMKHEHPLELEKIKEIENTFNNDSAKNSADAGIKNNNAE
ncbi:MAG: cytochrome c3 family protein [Ignavibacteriales bacterium]|nr:cytochrome c3 family protein [Ignavibacteriales bacterium]